MSAFLIGKTPAVGDFFSRGLAPAAARVWDDWAAAEVQAMHDHLGPGFESCHECAPPLKFVLHSDALGGWTAGAVAPSVDSAGRRFLLAAGQAGLSAAEAAALGAMIAVSAETLLYQIIGEQLAPDEGLRCIAGSAPGEGALWAAGKLAAAIASGAVWSDALDLFVPARGLEPGVLLRWMKATAEAMEAVA